MKLLTISCQKNLEDEVQGLLNNLEIKGYTLLAGVDGNGKWSTVSATRSWSNRNTLFLVTLEEEQIFMVVRALKDLRAALVRGTLGREAPFKIFLQPCEQIF
jgi:predicted AAA+ superfamily ATPase